VSGYEYKPGFGRALELILGRFPHPGPVVELPLEEARGKVAARDVTAPGPFPAADLSMMDGFACGAGAPAGERFPVRTGEAVPDWAGGVIPREEAERPEAAGDAARWARNVVARGGEYRRGDPLLRRGEAIGHARLSQLALFGFRTAAVHRPPRIAAGLFDGRPFAAAVAAWLEGFLAAYGEVDFRPAPIAGAGGLAPLAGAADLVLAVSDGAPGRYDEIKGALLGGAAGFRPIFWKLSLNPCRHVGFGVIGATPVLVLPDVFFKTVVSAVAFLPWLLTAWTGGRPATIPASWAAVPELRHPLPCLVPLRFEAGADRCPRAVATPLASSFSARGVVDAEGWVILEAPPRAEETFDALVLGRSGPGR
jgi:molybdopterin molybdotransferase